MLSQSAFSQTDIGELVQNIKEFLQYLISPQLQEKVFAFKIVFIGISVFFLLWIIYFLFKTSYLKYTFIGNREILSEFKDFGQRKIVKRWKEIKKRLEKDIEAQWKIGLLEADKLLDEILARVGYSGRNLDEKLGKLKKEDLSNLERVIAAHRICGDVARDPDYKLPKERAEEVLNIIEKALIELQAL